MCTTGGGEGGQKTKRQAARWYANEAKEGGWRDWVGFVRFVLVHPWRPAEHTDDCRWANLLRALGWV